MALPLSIRDSRIPLPTMRRAQMQQEMLYQAERNRVARARFASGQVAGFDSSSSDGNRGSGGGRYNTVPGESLLDDEQQSRYAIYPGTDEEDEEAGGGGGQVRIPRNHADRNQMHVAAFLDDYIQEHAHSNSEHRSRGRAEYLRERERARQHFEENGVMLDCLSSAVFFIRKHLKLWVVVAIIIYATAVINKQRDTDGWLSTRQVGYKQTGQCTRPNAHYGVVETGGDALVRSWQSGWDEVATVFVTDLKQEDEMSLCFSDPKLYDKLVTRLNDRDDPNSNDSFTSEEELHAQVANFGIAHSYFPSINTIMVFAVCTALTTLAMDSFDDQNPDESAFRMAGGSDLTFLQRFNHVTALFLFLMLALSGQYTRWLQPEDCWAAFGVNSTNINQNADEIELCKYLNDNNLELASVIIPPEPWIKAYKSIVTMMAFTLIVGIIVKPLPGAMRPNLATVLPMGLLDLVQGGRADRRGGLSNVENAHRSRNSRREERVERGARRDRDRQEDAEDTTFAQRYNQVAKRKKMTETWSLLQKLPAGSSDEDRNRCCTVCLEPLFPSTADAEGADAPVVGGGGDELDLEANLPTKSKAGDTGAAGASASNAAADEMCFELPCRHRYHKSCILEWALNHSTCPECRANLDGSTDKPGSSNGNNPEAEETEEDA